MSAFDQARFDVRCEWGERGLAALAPSSDVVIVVDVLCFSTCVDIATARGAEIVPFRFDYDAAREHAAGIGTEAAARRGQGRYSLSPGTFLDVPRGTRVVLPSPNGATLSVMAGERPTLAGCLRNAAAAAKAALELGRRVAVIPAGERWPDGTLRPALEDWLGAGAIVEGLSGSRSPEACAAAAAYRAARADLGAALSECGSGRELIARGYPQDIALASELDVSHAVPRLVEGAYVKTSGVA
jgi:2-phosphosulfolactate phosphatase